MHASPAVVGSGMALPATCFTQQELCDGLCLLIDGARPPQPDQTKRRAAELFRASRVAFRHLVVDPRTYYRRAPALTERMRDYVCHAHPLALAALSAALDASDHISAEDLTDLVVVSCTGYAAPGVDVLVARDLGLRHDLRRTVIGHMGCYGALVGLREAAQICRARPEARVAILAVELSSLHYIPSQETGPLTAMALFGDAAACVVLSAQENSSGPHVVDGQSTSDFSAMDQMTWNVTENGFEMSLSWRVPVSLGRNIRCATDRLLSPHELDIPDVDHWLIHPGGPSILAAIQERLGLDDRHMAPAWEILHDCGNCSSTTVLLMLHRLLQSGAARPGDWGVMMAFGPGLTLETCLLHF